MINFLVGIFSITIQRLEESRDTTESGKMFRRNILESISLLLPSYFTPIALI